MKQLLVAVAMMLSAGGAAAVPINADPLGLELGVATLADVKAKLKGNSFSDSGTSAIAGGPMLLVDSPDFGPEGLQSALFVFDAQGRLAAVQMTMPKDFGGKNVNAIANQLGAKYTQKKRNIPPVGNASARYVRGKSVVTIDAPHMSFAFTVSYMTDAFEQAMVAREDAERQRKADRTKQSL